MSERIGSDNSTTRERNMLVRKLMSGELSYYEYEIVRLSHHYREP